VARGVCDLTETQGPKEEVMEGDCQMAIPALVVLAEVS